MRRGVVVPVVLSVLASFVVGACGGDDTPTATDQEYVDALIEGLLAADDTPDSVSDEDARCLAQAIVDVYGAGDFEDADLSVADVRDPDADLGALSGPDAEQARQLGEGVQACRVGDAFAVSFAEGLSAGEEGEACVAQRLDDDPDVAPFLGALMVTRDEASARDAAALIDVLVECVDLGAGFIQQFFTLTEAELACLDTELEGTDEFKEFMARSLVGEDVNENDLGAATGPALTTCLTPARLAEIGVTRSAE
jgi:hypothetical protein